MTASNHTPGPWRWVQFSEKGCWDMKRATIEKDGPFQGLWSDGANAPVAIAQDASAYTASFIDPDSPDAHLIAAAPSMRAALEWLDQHPSNCGGTGLAKARAALALARGETPA